MSLHPHDLGLIFDLDGTLVDSAPDLQAAVGAMLAQEGAAPLDLTTTIRFIGNGVPTLVKRARAHRGLAEAGHDAGLARFHQAYDAQGHALSAPYPGVRAALAELGARGHQMALCTNKPEAPARALLKGLGLAEHFQAVIGGDTMPAHKPDPRPALAARTHLSADRVAFLGDSEVDAQTARAAELPFVLFTRGYRKTPAETIPATARFAAYKDLPDLLMTL